LACFFYGETSSAGGTGPSVWVPVVVVGPAAVVVGESVAGAAAMVVGGSVVVVVAPALSFVLADCAM